MSEEALPAVSPGSSGTPPTPRKSVLQRVAGLLRDVFGKPRFDDRLDTQPDIRTAAALVIIGRSVKLLAEVKWLFTLKALLQFVMIIPGLLLPWMAKIVVDNVMLQEPFGQTEVLYPPFMYPILALVEGRDPLGIMLTLTTLYFVMLLIAGSRTDGTDAGLLEGRDAATQAENRLSAGGSEGSGLLGLVEFMAHVRLTQSIANRLRSRLFDRLTRLPMTVLDDQRTGDSIFRVLYDTPLAPGLAYSVTLLPFFMLLGALINLYVLQYSYGDVSPQLVVVAWLAVPAAFIATFPFSGALRRTNQNMRAAGSATTNAMEESMSNIAAVQSLGAGKEENRRFAERSSETFLRERYAILVIIVAAAVAGGVFGIAAIYVTILISDGIIEGSMSPGDFAVLMGIYWSISIAAGYFGAWWIKLQDMIAAVRRVFFFLDHPSEHDRLGGVELEDIGREVELEGVGFSYPDGQEALRDIDLKLPMGELVAIVGPTGAGKTTLAYLVPSLLTPTTGSRADRRPRRHGTGCGQPAASRHLRLPRTRPAFRDDSREPPARQSRSQRGTDDVGPGDGGLHGLHQRSAGWHRHAVGAFGGQPVGRPAATPVHRPRPRAGREGPDSGRTYRSTRSTDRECPGRVAAGSRRGTARHRHRASAVDDPPR